VRWDGLSTTTDGTGSQPTLPIAGAVTRTFDTPEFRGMTFYEVQAKSIINRVPAASRMPFEWTVNPYRGCTHACVYCLSGDTPMLMADGRTRPLAELRVGDRIYGTVRQGHFRRYAITEVLAHWSTAKPAYRVTLRDGTELVTSGDHRFLTARGWKHVSGGEWGGRRRPHLVPGDKLVGTGRFAAPPPDSEDYRRGYLCGVIRTDGRAGSQVAVAALERLRRYLEEFQVAAIDSALRDASRSRRTVTALRGSGRLEVRLFTGLLRWPAQPGDDWRKGFLAGVFDAEGQYNRSVLRVSHSDHEMIKQSADCLRALGFDVVLDAPARAGGSSSVRVRGGLREHLRFFHTVDPAVTDKRAVEGIAVTAHAPLAVVSVDRLGVELPLFDITTGTGDFIADGVVSHNCFARNTHTYLDLDAGHDFDTRVVVKVNAGQLLRRELGAPRWAGAQIAMGTNVDCYQRAEGRYQLMRGILAALRDFANPFSILTKGTLILRDLDLLTQAAEVTGVGLSMSVGFVDEALWRSVEPGTPSPRRRLDAVRRLSDAGFAVGVLMAPILPGITDTPESIDETVRAVAAAGAASVVPLALHLRPGAREWYLRWLARERPDLLPRYRELYGDRAYLGSGYQREVSARVRLAARRHGLDARAANTARRVAASPEQARVLGAEPVAQPAVGEQLTLL
jgi:DNA repair photolyase